MSAEERCPTCHHLSANAEMTLKNDLVKSALEFQRAELTEAVENIQGWQERNGNLVATYNTKTGKWVSRNAVLALIEGSKG